jgi:hypothetical protein
VPTGSPYHLRFAYKTAVWHTENIKGPAGSGGVDIEVDDSDQVIIVYNTRDSGLWCARGMVADVVGVRQTSGQHRGSQVLLPTFHRDVLFMPGASSIERMDAWLLDASGRRVMELRAGANDVRALAQGVYFVCDESQTVQKVVLQR